MTAARNKRNMVLNPIGKPIDGEARLSGMEFWKRSGYGGKKVNVLHSSPFSSPQSNRVFFPFHISHMIAPSWHSGLGWIGDMG